MEDLICFIIERQNIYIKKEILKLKYPWTDNDIMRNYYFTNVNRQLDKCSKYELEYLKNNTNEIKQLYFILVSDLMDIILEYKDSDCLENKIINWCNENKLNSAIIWSWTKGSKYTKDIYNYIINLNKHIITYHSVIKSIDCPYKLLKYIKDNLKHIGDFKAYEIYTSLTYTDIIKFKENDIEHIGPGSINMLKSLGFNNLKDLRDIIKKELENRQFIFIYPFTNRTIEDVLCEYRKYTNIKLKGKGKRKYHFKK